MKWNEERKKKKFKDPDSNIGFDVKEKLMWILRSYGDENKTKKRNR